MDSICALCSGNLGWVNVTNGKWVDCCFCEGGKALIQSNNLEELKKTMAEYEREDVIRRQKEMGTAFKPSAEQDVFSNGLELLNNFYRTAIKERDHWKANHDEQVKNKQEIQRRKDLIELPLLEKIRKLEINETDLNNRVLEMFMEIKRAFRDQAISVSEYNPDDGLPKCATYKELLTQLVDEHLESEKYMGIIRKGLNPFNGGYDVETPKGIEEESQETVQKIDTDKNSFDLKPMPTGVGKYNSNTPCDMANGPCACGAWHNISYVAQDPDGGGFVYEAKRETGNSNYNVASIKDPVEEVEKSGEWVRFMHSCSKVGCYEKSIGTGTGDDGKTYEACSEHIKELKNPGWYVC